jgi:hypothetical protein
MEARICKGEDDGENRDLSITRQKKIHTEHLCREEMWDIGFAGLPVMKQVNKGSRAEKQAEKGDRIILIEGNESLGMIW